MPLSLPLILHPQYCLHPLKVLPPPPLHTHRSPFLRSIILCDVTNICLDNDSNWLQASLSPQILEGLTFIHPLSSWSLLLSALNSLPEPSPSTAGCPYPTISATTGLPQLCIPTEGLDTPCTNPPQKWIVGMCQRKCVSKQGRDKVGNTQSQSQQVSWNLIAMAVCFQLCFCLVKK